MKIKGELCEYEVDWCGYGWTGAEAVVKKRAKLFGFIPYWTTVWRSGPDRVRQYEAYKFHPHQFKNWFARVVKEYEAYEKAWAENKE